jgi:HIRAN domain-containing protein
MKRTITTRVAGVTFERRQEALASLRLDSIEVCPEPRNPYDANALAVWAVTDSGERVQIGYIPRGIAAEVTPRVQDQRRLPGVIVGWQGGEDGLYIGVTVRFEYDDGGDHAR